MIGGAVGAAIAVGLMEYLSAQAHYPLMLVPFGTSIVLVMGMPQADPSRPRALVGGHLVSALVGLLVVKLLGPASWTAALAVGLAMLAMHASDTFHPPAGINPIIIVLNDLSWSFLLAPVGVGSVLLAVFAALWHAGLRGSLHRESLDRQAAQPVGPPPPEHAAKLEPIRTKSDR
jgi:CBS-domain-containing membrane protein